MNKLERFIYDLVKSKPWLKLLIRNIYQGIFDLFPRKKEYSFNPLISRKGYFFGFHDITPFSNDNSKILANELKFDLRMPTKEDEINLGYFDFDGKKIGCFNIIGTTRSWNYHKGCRLQWLNDNEVIFNKADKANVLKSQIVNVQTKQSRDINYAIDSVSFDGKYATSISYERLEKCMPGYGYQFRDEGCLDEYSPKKTGLFLIDLNNNSRKLIVSIDELVKELDDDIFSTGYWHFVTHSEFSHDRRYVSFLHRWVGNDIKKRWTRLIVYDLIDNKWFSLPTTGWGVSHYVWNNKNQILAYCNIDDIDCHALFDIAMNKHKKIATKDINSDGHQSFIEDHIFITDTYPDKYRMSKLYRVNINTDETDLLASVYSPKKFQTKSYYKHIACDLHPRVSENGEYVCFDTVQTGKRAIAVMPLK